MDRKEVLELLRELINDPFLLDSSEDGVTSAKMFQDKLIRAIDFELDKEV